MAKVRLIPPREKLIRRRLAAERMVKAGLDEMTAVDAALQALDARQAERLAGRLAQRARHDACRAMAHLDPPFRSGADCLLLPQGGSGAAQAEHLLPSAGPLAEG